MKAAPAPAQSRWQLCVEEDLTDDLGAVAVITAAIAASQNTSRDRFVVRSIKKVNRSTWREPELEEEIDEKLYDYCKRKCI